ncbi:hypothetical protein FVER53590_28344 [Fusarium verticillioides]|nr:hypothetical protein FVER53590_28344 [Fusarium verticillioides]
MASPLTAPPLPMPVEGKTVQPKDMRACKVRQDCQASLELPDGTIKQYTLAAGTIGYIVKDVGEKSIVQVVNQVGDKAKCKIERSNLDAGKLNSEFRIALPGVRQATSPGQGSGGRSNDLAAKATRALWDNIRENRDMLQQLGMKVDIFNTVLKDAQKMSEAIEAIVDAFYDDSWKAMNAPSLSLEAFLDLPEMDEASSNIDSNQALIYLRLYYKGQKFAKYGGQTTRPMARQQEHDAMTDKGINQSNHYRTARKFPPDGRHPVAMMKLTDASQELINMAETTLCCLLRTWSPEVMGCSQESIAEGLASGIMDDRLLVSALCQITDAALKDVGYPEFAGVGCNWNCPIQERHADRREWVRYSITTKDNRKMLVYRWQSAVTPAEKGISLLFLSRYDDATKKQHGVRLHQILDHLPGIRPGNPLIVSVELMEDGKPHPQPWYRHPYHGAWSNCHELHSFAIKIEWQDEMNQRWYTYPLQDTMTMNPYPGAPDDATVTASWRKATSILQVFHNRRYRNPPTYLEAKYNTLIKEAVYDHLSQTVTMRPVHETIVDPPTHVSFEHNVRELGKATATIWQGIAVGPVPDQAWVWGTEMVKGSGRTLRCLICRTSSIKSNKSDCLTRPGIFEVDAGEPSRNRILSGSCQACWQYFRRPCVWGKRGFGGVPGNPSLTVLPRGYEGLAIAAKYSGPPIVIKAPMNIAMYAEAQELADDLNELDLTGGQVDGEN